MRPLIARRHPASGPRAEPPLSRAPRAEAPVDPAPSRWSYRVQRLWLTPLFRAILRVGLPSFVLVLLAGSYFGNEANRAALVDSLHEIRREIENRPEFRVNVLGITGASPSVTEDIRAALALDLPMSSFDTDLDELRARVEALPAVAWAELRLQSGGYLAVTVREREPVLIWQTRDGPVLLDGEGQYVAALSQRPGIRGLPSVAGDGADLVVDEALALIAAATPLGDRLRGLVRMGERRWDVVLGDERRIQLPAAAPVQALDRVLALHDVTDLFGRDVLRVDLRNPQRLTVQMSPEALVEYRRLREIDAQTRAGDQAG